jgi:hypothetical protein
LKWTPSESPLKRPAGTPVLFGFEPGNKLPGYSRKSLRDFFRKFPEKYSLVPQRVKKLQAIQAIQGYRTFRFSCETPGMIRYLTSSFPNPLPHPENDQPHVIHVPPV